MKNILVAVISVFVFTQTFSQSEKSIKETDIKEIKIYLNGAAVTRTFKTTVEPGITKLSVDFLSPYINPQSINVSGIGDLTIMSVVHQQNYLNESKPTPEVKELKDSLEAMQDDMTLLQNSKYILDQEESLLLENKKAGNKDGLIADQLDKLSNVFVQRLTVVKEKQYSKNKQIKKLQMQIDKVNNQLNLLRQKYVNGTGSIVVTVSSKLRATATLDVSYVVANASWTPHYDIRATDTNSPLQLGYTANVIQSTGEDWDKVKLKLSTGNPTLSGTKPELFPWYLNFAQPVQTYAPMYKKNENYLNTVPSQAEGVNRSGVAEDQSKPVTYAWSNVEVSENQLATDFDIKVPYSIPSDGKQYQVEIQNYILNATYNYASVPKRDRDAFLTAYVKDWEELNLVAGDASIYFQNSFVGETTINTRSAEDSLVFSLGRDKRIVVMREKLKDFSSKQFLGNNVSKTFTYEISVKNTKKETVALTVEEQIPLSQNSEIEVKLIESNEANYNTENGKLTWIVNVAPGETQKRKFSFSVKYPKGKIVSGL